MFIIQNDHIYCFSLSNSLIFAPVISIYTIFWSYDTILSKITAFFSCCIIIMHHFLINIYDMWIKNVMQNWIKILKIHNLRNVPCYMMNLCITSNKSIQFLLNLLIKYVSYAQFEAIMNSIIWCIMFEYMHKFDQTLEVYLSSPSKIMIKSDIPQMNSFNLMQFSFNSRMICLFYDHFLIHTYGCYVMFAVSIEMLKLLFILII